jgi:acetoacetate decarboxylase
MLSFSTFSLMPCCTRKYLAQIKTKTTSKTLKTEPQIGKLFYTSPFLIPSTSLISVSTTCSHKFRNKSTNSHKQHIAETEFMQKILQHSQNQTLHTHLKRFQQLSYMVTFPRHGAWVDVDECICGLISFWELLASP